MYGLLVFVSVLQICHGALVDPDNYIIEVTATCPVTASSGPATITVKTDLPSSKPFAECSNGQFNFDVNNIGIWSLEAFTDLNHTRECIFYHKPTNASVFSISVYVPLSDRVLTINIPEKLVTCIYDPIGDQKSALQELEESKKPAKQIEQFMAAPSPATVDVCVAGVDDKCITGNIRIGRPVKIRAEITGNTSEAQGFQAISCIARGRSYEFPLLSGGCGDGSMIPKHLGFTTTGTVALSPPFKAFRVPGSNSLTYDCSFVICSKTCDGSSCAKSAARRKRDTAYVEHIGGSGRSVNLEGKEQINSGIIKVKKELPYSSRLTDYDDDEADNRQNSPQQPDLNIPKNKQETSGKIASPFWAKETVLIILLASITMIFMAVTARILINITRSVGHLKENIQQNKPGVYLISHE